jgi:predicted metal-dependent phosphoesterase TrpH
MLRVELHSHSEFSRDCGVPLDRIVAICERRGIEAIALTDHNELAGALELQRRAPAWLRVIVGEEIATAQGDVIGLFLRARIAPRRDAEETIQEIRAQGGIVVIPHPFDRLRREAIGGAVLDRLKDQIDFVEVFNSRCVFPADNRKAADFARAHRLPGVVGSDAHLPREYGRAVCLIEPFHDRAEFRTNLCSAQFVTRYADPLVHVQTKITNLKAAATDESV